MIKFIRGLGWMSVGFGILAALLCLYSLKLGVFLGFTGFLCTSLYIALNLKHQVNTQKLNPGAIGLILNSIPILYIIILIVLAKVNH